MVTVHCKDLNRWVFRNKRLVFLERKNTHLFLVLPPGGVQRLNECSRMPHKHGKAGSTYNHAENGEPHISHAYRGVQAIPDAQHVTHGLEQGIGVLLTPRVILQEIKTKVY